MADKFIPYHKKELSTKEQLQKSTDFCKPTQADTPPKALKKAAIVLTYN